MQRYRWLCQAMTVVLAMCCACSPGSSQPVPPVTGYLLRVENALFGRVELSVDHGRTYTLVGRVTRPATSATPDRSVPAGGTVVRASREGLAFGAGPKLVLKLRPEWTPARPGDRSVRPPAAEPSVIQTDLPPGHLLFRELLPPVGTRVQVRTADGELRDIPPGYAPAPGDLFVFSVLQADASGAAGNVLRERIEALGRAYAQEAETRGRRLGRKVVSGTLTLQARLPSGEPDPIHAVAYLVDDELLAVQNTPPFSYAWDTTRATDGEHVVEIRAFNREGRRITSARALVVVRNRPGIP
ncbi:MAG: hypothetical protein RMJ43_10225 [Chloroherpetonaceae bacterium]|nr:hypothetical protein [Chthonomonadaceae bacterium]MDW8208204.1 hypothetical protein [Chloroherpetonaceae bacterium]